MDFEQQLNSAALVVESLLLVLRTPICMTGKDSGVRIIVSLKDCPSVKHAEEWLHRYLNREITFDEDPLRQVKVNYWHYTFDNHAGYDCMSGGYTVKDENDKTIVTVDCVDFVNEDDFDGDDYEKKYWDAVRLPNLAAEAIAKLIVEANNRHWSGAG